MAEAIKMRREAKGLTQAQLAEQVGISRQAISAIEAGKNMPSGSTLRQIEAVLQLESNQSQATVLPAGAAGNVTNARLLRGDWKVIPVPLVSARARAGFAASWLEDVSRDELDVFPHILLPDEAELRDALAFEVNGDSMDPTLRTGTVIVTTPVQEGHFEYASGGLFVVLYLDQLVVKRIKTNDMVTTGAVTLHSDNPEGGTLTIKRDDVRAMWRVRRAIVQF